MNKNLVNTLTNYNTTEKLRLELITKWNFFKFLLRVIKFQLTITKDEAEVMSLMKCSYLAKVSWMLRVNPYLNSLTPRAALKLGRKELVIEEALQLCQKIF